ncbi:MAG: hypothetical protein M1820_010668 [Bogoriella megaspora]|nr:MAG: hypothetical protein M1820_010668 [Bogoriella megaspora]
MPVTTIDPPTLGKPHPLYAAITAAPLSPTSTLYTISGQVAEDPVTGTTPPDLSSQLDICLRRLDICLEHINAKKVDITRFMYYIKQSAIEDLDAERGNGSALKLIGGRVGMWMEGHRPASCYNRVFGMSDDKFLCEFEAMAVLTKEH